MSQLIPPAYGQYDAQGRLAKDTDVCAISGLRVEPGDVLVKIKGTPLFYRLKAFVFAGVTPDAKAALEDRIKAAALPSSPRPARSTPAAPADPKEG